MSNYHANNVAQIRDTKTTSLRTHTESELKYNSEELNKYCTCDKYKRN